MRCCLAGPCLALSLAAPASVHAQAASRDRVWHGTIFAGQWFAASEPAAGTGLGSPDAGFQDSYFVSLQASRVIVPELRTGWPLIGSLIDGGSLELEAQAGRHFGLQDHGELTLALFWRSRDVALPWSGGRVNLALGEGLSYALSRPDYEGVAQGEEPRRFLNYLAVELEFSHPALSGVSVVPRLHHRSGIFGLIAPRGSGSDFIGLGLRMTLQ